MSLDHDDYATLARIEDHLRRIADALERAHPPKLTAHPLRPGERRWDDCETRGPKQCEPGCVRPSLHDGDCRGSVEGSGGERPDLNAKTAFGEGRIGHGPERCIHGTDHPDTLTCEYLCSATMPGHWCTRREHADDRHVWAMSDEEAERILRAGQELGFIAEPDPLDEGNHRPRHNRHGGHVYRHGPNHWHDYGLEDGRCDMEPAGDDPVRLSDFPGPLTFCDCDDATIEAENGATD